MLFMESSDLQQNPLGRIGVVNIQSQKSVKGEKTAEIKWKEMSVGTV